MALLGMFSVILIPAIVEINDPSLKAKVNAIGLFVLLIIPLITINALKHVPDSSESHSGEKLTNPFKHLRVYLATKC